MHALLCVRTDLDRGFQEQVGKQLRVTAWTRGALLRVALGYSGKTGARSPEKRPEAGGVLAAKTIFSHKR